MVSEGDLRNETVRIAPGYIAPARTGSRLILKDFRGDGFGDVPRPALFNIERHDTQGRPLRRPRRSSLIWTKSSATGSWCSGGRSAMQ